MGYLNWTKTSPASSLVRSEAFWCIVLGPEAERQEGSEREEAAKRKGGTSIVPQCGRIVQKRLRKERDPRSIRCGDYSWRWSPGLTNDQLCGWKCQLTGTVKECPIPMSFRCSASSLHPRGQLWHTRILCLILTFFFTNAIFFSLVYCVVFQLVDCIHAVVPRRVSGLVDV